MRENRCQPTQGFMPKKFIKRFMPDHKLIRNHKTLNRVFGTLLHDPNLLHMNRRSVSGAFFVGLFLAFVPLPIQMILGVALSILLRINMPITLGLFIIALGVTATAVLEWKAPDWLEKAKPKGLQLLNTRLSCVYSEATAPIVSLGLYFLMNPV